MKELLQELIQKSLRDNVDIGDLIKAHEQSEALVEFLLDSSKTEKSVEFDANLFKDFHVGSFLRHDDNGVTTLENLRPKDSK